MKSYSSVILLLVDGYNIIGDWYFLKTIKEQQGLELARAALIEVLVNYTGYKGLQAKIVFDAHYQKTPSYEEKCTSRVSVHYTTYGETADTYIEKLCASISRRNPSPFSRLIVATSDQAQRHTVVGYGAEWFSAQKLAREVEISKKKGRKNFRPQQKSQKRFLFNALDPKTQQTLSELRHGIDK